MNRFEWKSIGWTGTNWKECFERLGAVVHDGFVNDVIGPKTLLVSNCSKTKGTEGDSAVPRDFYKGTTPQLLMDFGDAHKLRWAILSDLYGIHYSDEKLKFYDIAPDQVADPDKLARLICKRAKERGHDSLVYYCPSPLRARPYIYFLSKTGLRFTYVKKLRYKKAGEGFGL